jgi:hypothetical protein
VGLPLSNGLVRFRCDMNVGITGCEASFSASLKNGIIIADNPTVNVTYNSARSATALVEHDMG